MDAALLVAYLALPALALWRSRSTARTVIITVGVWALASALLSFAHEVGVRFTRLELQITLLGVLACVAVIAWYGGKVVVPGRQQVLGVWLPVVVAVGALSIVAFTLVDGTAFTKPVGFLMGLPAGEDNADWLDYAAQLADGGSITQGVPLGPALGLWLTFMSTAMGVVSQVLFSGFNEVAVAANTVVMGEFLLAAVAPLALAPLAEARLRRSQLPAAPMAIGAVVLLCGSTVLIAYGHHTLQATILIAALWCATFVARPKSSWSLLLTSAAVVVCGVVWLPFTIVSFSVLGGLLLWMAWRSRQGITRRWLLQASVVAVVLIGAFGPLRSAFAFATGFGGAAASGAGGAAGGVVASTGPLAMVPLPFGLAESGLFAAGGGTEIAGPLLVILAIVGVLATAWYLRGSKRSAVRLLPIAVIAGAAVAMSLLDFWLVGKGPNYGSLKFGFMAAVVIAGVTVPTAIVSIDAQAGRRMSTARWAASGAVLLLLAFDSLLPRAVSTLRPALWTPPIPFNNTSGSYWYPAEVNGERSQPIAMNPVACVYLPQGWDYPTALVPSGLSDAQRVYECTRLLAGLSAADESGQALVDWMRREWLTNTPSWVEVHDFLAGMPPEVRVKPVILLDDGSNVKGLESVDALLQRFPKPAA